MDASALFAKLRHPVLQAPMAGGGDTPALVAAVGEAGGLGSIGAAYLSPERIRAASAEVRDRTRAPFGINLFAPTPWPTAPTDSARALRHVAPYYAALGLAPPALPAQPSSSFDELLAAALDSGAAVFSFTFGIPPPAALSAARARGMLLFGTATTVQEAVLLERAGVDALVAQGAEAGGHRGTFAGDFEAGLVGTMALVPQMVDAVRVPVVASGGIMDGRGVAAALALGARAAQLGTAFLTCEEAGVSEAYKSAVLAAHEDETRLTRAFSGRPARGIVNRFLRETAEPDILPFPLQNALTRPLRTAAAQAGDASLLSLWAGQGVRLARRTTAAALIERLASETRAAIAALATPR